MSFDMTFRDPNRFGRRLMEKRRRGAAEASRKYRASEVQENHKQQRHDAVKSRQFFARQRALDRGSKLAWAKEPAEKRPWAKV